MEWARYLTHSSEVVNLSRLTPLTYKAIHFNSVTTLSLTTLTLFALNPNKNEHCIVQTKSTAEFQQNRPIGNVIRGDPFSLAQVGLFWARMTFRSPRNFTGDFRNGVGYRLVANL